MQCTLKYFRVDRKEIAFLRFVLEAYSGLVLMRTLDAAAGAVVMHVPPGCRADFEDLMRALAEEVLIEPLSGSG